VLRLAVVLVPLGSCWCGGRCCPRIFWCSFQQHCGSCGHTWKVESELARRRDGKGGCGCWPWSCSAPVYCWSIMAIFRWAVPMICVWGTHLCRLLQLRTVSWLIPSCFISVQLHQPWTYAWSYCWCFVEEWACCCSSLHSCNQSQTGSLYLENFCSFGHL